METVSDRQAVMESIWKIDKMIQAIEKLPSLPAEQKLQRIEPELRKVVEMLRSHVRAGEKSSNSDYL